MQKVDSYAWPGGYPLFYFVKSDDGLLHACPNCVNSNRVGTNVKKVDGHINWEDDTLTCDACEKPIESAYGK